MHADHQSHIKKVALSEKKDYKWDCDCQVYIYCASRCRYLVTLHHWCVVFMLLDRRKIWKKLNIGLTWKLRKVCGKQRPLITKFVDKFWLKFEDHACNLHWSEVKYFMKTSINKPIVRIIVCNNDWLVTRVNKLHNVWHSCVQYFYIRDFLNEVCGAGKTLCKLVLIVNGK